MKQLRLLALGLLFFVISGLQQQAFGKVVGKRVEYAAQGTTLKGYLVYNDKISGKRPGILVVHEWWGLNDYIRKRAQMFAELGYTALAVDMYGEGKMAGHPAEAGKFSSELMKNFNVAKARFGVGLDFLSKEPTVDPQKIAAVGYCFGGGVVLNMAAQGLAVKGVASFHGTLALVTPPQPGQVKAKILVLHGENDKFSTPEQIEAFKSAMQSAGADVKFLVYPDALHAFTNPEATENGRKFNIPIAYNEKADKQSWEDMKQFLRQIFK